MDKKRPSGFEVFLNATEPYAKSFIPAMVAFTLVAGVTMDKEFIPFNNTNVHVRLTDKDGRETTVNAFARFRGYKHCMTGAVAQASIEAARNFTISEMKSELHGLAAFRAAVLERINTTKTRICEDTTIQRAPFYSFGSS